MDKRLTQLLESGIEITDTCMLDTYNQQVQDNVSCTIRTNINTANHHFIMETETPLLVGNIYPNKSKSGRDMQAGRVYDKNGISPCLSQMEGGNTEPKILSYTRSREDGSIQNRHLNDVANTIHGSTGQGGNTDSYVVEPCKVDENYIEPQIQSCEKNQSAPKVINPLKGESQYGWHFEQEVYDEKGIARAVKAGGGSGNIPKVIQEPMNLYPNSGNPQAGRVYNAEGISPAMDTCTGGNRMPKITENLRIRKLTPCECWRLMGVRDEQFNKLHDLSNTQLYKLAGNSIVVDVLMGIFKNLLISDEGTRGQLTLF